MRDYRRSEAMYQRAVKTIPQGSQTFSKSAQNFVHGAAPLFLERGRGARVFDVDGQEYIDYILALGPVILGYADPDVNAAIVAQLERGISFTLTSELEAELSELLCELIPCAQMTRFAKNGSDVTSGAIRIARAATGRDRVAVCGYHGWHDWYIGSTARHLGVPAAVRELTSTFAFNDAASLAAVLDAHPSEYAAVMLEPTGAIAPQAGFLEEVAALTRSHGAVLVFDEIVTGFRTDMGGAQARYGVVPDLACFGKGMANGMPLAALTGNRHLMEMMADVFVSGTFGGETLSLAASIATLRKLKRTDAVRRMHDTGAKLKAEAQRIIERHDLQATLSMIGDDWRPVLSVMEAQAGSTLVMSLVRQETAQAGLLFGSGFTLCLEHTDNVIVEQTLVRWDVALGAIARALALNNPHEALRGRAVQNAFAVRKST